MGQDHIRYDILAQDALRSVIRKVLGEVAATGHLPGDHHFFITFDTRDPDVEMADWLRERYPEEMTIVIQHWFDSLEVRPEGFAITLNFGDSPEPLYIPFDALRTFVDPSVEFGLRFETQVEDDEDEDEDEADDASDGGEGAEDAPKGGGEVVSLDKWRK